MTKIALGLALLLSATSGAFAQYDGDNNPVPGAHQSWQGSFDGAYASTVYRPAPRALTRTIERDGDGNPIPGLQR